MAEPSKVIHIRNVGNAITEDELLELVKPFGAVAKLVMLRAKNQVLQMEDMEASASAVEHYTSVQANVRDLYLQFSSHQELTANDQTSQGQRSDQESQPNRSSWYPFTTGPIL